MSFTIKVGVKYNCNSYKTPNWKVYLIDQDGGSPAGDNSYNQLIQNVNTDLITIAVDIEDDTQCEYTLIVEHAGAVYPDDYEEGDFGIEITHLSLCDVDLCDLIHRQGHVYLDCSNNPYYIFDQIKNTDFSLEVLPHEINEKRKNPRLLQYRHNGVKFKNPFAYNNVTGETTTYEGIFTSACGNYIIKNNNLYYDVTNNIDYIAKNSDNEDLFVEGDFQWPWEINWRNFKFKSNNDIAQKMQNLCDMKNPDEIRHYLKNAKLIHHIPNNSCLSLNGRWEFKFKTPLYGWITDNIFGNDLK